MLVFYYQWPDGKTHLVCVRGNWYPTKHSPIWRGCNTCVAMVPGFDVTDETDLLDD